MTSLSVGEALARRRTLCSEDWSEIEALLEAPCETALPAVLRKRPRPQMALGLLALITLCGGSALLKAAIVPGCRGAACAPQLEASVSDGPAIRDVTKTPTLVAAVAEPIAMPLLQGRSIAAPTWARRQRLHVSVRAVAIPHPKLVATTSAARPHSVSRVPVRAPVPRPVAAPPKLFAHTPVPPRLAIAARPVTKQTMRSLAVRQVRLL